ncbi:MAG TPA: hypothetical protein PK990_01705 [Salinivirgaceae bacterium]|nr:hypothetical protein [Salinivirgaceae bacterium]
MISLDYKVFIFLTLTTTVFGMAFTPYSWLDIVFIIQCPISLFLITDFAKIIVYPELPCFQKRKARYASCFPLIGDSLEAD